MVNKSLVWKSAAILIIVIIAALLIFTASRGDTSGEDRQILPVKTIYAEKGDLEKLLRISGFIESETMVTVLPRIGGTLTDLFIEMGDPVEEGQVIAVIDSEPYQLSFTQAKAAFLAAESTFKRISSLYSTNSVSRQNYDEAKANYDALKSTYDLAELNLSYTELRAPVQGVILEKHVSRGSMVAPEVPVVTIGDIEDLKVNSGVPEIHYSFFQKHKGSMGVKITVPALNNNIFDGVISNIAPYISALSRSFIVNCRVIDEKALLRPGMFAYLDFILEKKLNIYYLPYEVLAGGDTLWYIDEEGRARSLVYVPSFGNEEYFQIDTDIASYRFIVEGQNFINNGQVVRILEDL